jgi:hypothetical protein
MRRPLLPARCPICDARQLNQTRLIEHLEAEHKAERYGGPSIPERTTDQQRKAA